MVLYNTLRQKAIKLLLLWKEPLYSSFFAFLIYAVYTHYNHDSLFAKSPFPYYNYLADAFLHGQFHLRLIPPDVHDLIKFSGNYYLYWPPFPSIVIMPIIAVFGVNVSDIFYTLLIGVGNVFVVASILRDANKKNIIVLNDIQRSLLVFFFAVGTVHVTLAPFGRVWFTGQLIGLLCVSLAYWSVIRLPGVWAFLGAGLALAGAILTRNHLVLTGIWLVYYLISRNREKGWLWITIRGIVGVLPIVIGLGFLAYYNWSRFGNFLEVGLDYHMMSDKFVADYQLFGPFNLHYLPTNLYYQLLFYPFPLKPESIMGGSFLLLSPVFICSFSAFLTKEKLSATILLLTIVIVYIPILLLMGTGWVQFGSRYTLDFTVPLLLLTAIGMKKWTNRQVLVLTAISTVHFLIGTLFFMNFV